MCVEDDEEIRLIGIESVWWGVVGNMIIEYKYGQILRILIDRLGFFFNFIEEY